MSSFAAPSHKLRASAQDSASGDLPPRNDKKVVILRER